MKKRTTIKRKTGKRNQHQSMLVTEKSRFLNEMPTSGELKNLNGGWDVDALVESLKCSALAFLVERNVPIDDAPHGSAGVLLLISKRTWRPALSRCRFCPWVRAAQLPQRSFCFKSSTKRFPEPQRRN